MIKYLTLEQLIEIHDEMLLRFGGLAGIRDANLLQSVIEIPKAIIFGQEMYPSIYEKAAIYLYSITRNHPFNDANKRTAYVATLIFLKGNKIKIQFKLCDLEKIVKETAKGKISKESLAQFLSSSQ